MTSDIHETKETIVMEAPLRINVAYAVPPGSRKIHSWYDGFTAAMGLIGERHDVRWTNVHPAAGDVDPDLLECDFLLVKANWDGVAHHRTAPLLHSVGAGTRVGLMISGVAKPPPLYWRRTPFDVLWYETEWYARRVRRHPVALHAFGTDTDTMRPAARTQCDIDWLSVGQLVPYKRHERLCRLEGRRVVATDFATADPLVRDRLTAAGVELLDYLDAQDLAGLYRRSRNVLVNCTTRGGGERAVLEARACGANVVVAADNPKLAGLLAGPLYDHRYYAARLSDGIALALAGRPRGDDHPSGRRGRRRGRSRARPAPGVGGQRTSLARSASQAGFGLPSARRIP